MSAEALARLRNERLSQLVRYAREHSPLFGELYRGIDPQHVTLDMLPPTDKAGLTARFDD